MSGLAEAVARYYYKLLAYKDEYEVARLYTDGRFLAKLHRQFEGGFKLRFHLAPPLIAERDPDTGAFKKREFGAWVLPLMRVMARLKGVRGTAFDIFGYTAERRLERQLIVDYERTMAAIETNLNADNHALAVEIASVPEHIRGFGHVKERHLKQARARETELLTAFNSPTPRATAAE
jgi:indolepyruvate ferredoxin oxidoreductase